MRIVAVSSGKGGVGKSTVAFLLAKSLSQKKRVLLLDFDITGPSVSTLMKNPSESVIMKETLTPIKKTDTLSYLTIAAMIPIDSPVIWKAPKKLSLLSLFMKSADPSLFDFLVIDMPPGSTDEQNFLCEISGAEIVIVTTSQNLALDEAESVIEVYKEAGKEILGVIENMREMACPECGEKISVFSKNGGKMLSESVGVRYLGHIDQISRVEDLPGLPSSVSSLLGLLLDDETHPEKSE
ncbi:ATP-binding protein involved in chromosome partitioning [Nematocida major]|uniref:ATP-binding protein involved in chromosome partitioning n=1 Tax=Nematocida major TaxID=1912982 RepID=UPI002008C1C5|nr:ATP-binding protein involved in chromosome partitioning [Nematocida major]KAH9385805.1 ATP-binding protein involved in chromosome partitioning [Nematocida major]